MTKTFAELVDGVREKNRKTGEEPRPYRLIAEDCGISRQHLYNMMNGEQQPGDAVAERIAAGLGVAVSTVRKACKRSALVGR